MDIYLSSVLLGGLGLGAMALGGLGRHGHSSHSGHSGHAGHSGPGHSIGDGHVHVNVHVSGRMHIGRGGRGGRGHSMPQGKAAWLLSWPSVMFGFLLGGGATGLALQPFLPSAITALVAVTGGAAFQGLLIRPLWNFFLRFASAPALTSESADEATAVTSFNADGEGLVALEVDGQVVQVLGRLKPADRSLGVTVRAGQRLRVEEVNTANNHCTVSAL